MTLMMQKIGQDAARRCDARCYHGKSKTCCCMCGGRNHGTGLQKALNNIRDIFLPGYLDMDHAPIKISKRIRELAALRRRSDRERLNQRELFRRPLPAQKELFS
jgi:hypothetical protein